MKRIKLLITSSVFVIILIFLFSLFLKAQYATRIEHYDLIVACVNYSPVWGDKNANLKKIKLLISEASEKKADVIIFPELALTGYDIEPAVKMHKLNAEEIPGYSTNEILKYTRKYNVYVILGMPEKDKSILGIYYNSAVVVGPNGIIGSYRKMFPFETELAWATRGESPFYFDTQWGRIGIGICYDTYMYPELSRFYSALEAKIYINISALTAIKNWKEYYLNQLRARAIENMIFVASANLTGKDLTNTFPGSSVVLGPGKEYHTIITYAGPAKPNKQEIIYAKIDLSLLENMRRRYPLFKNHNKNEKPEWRVEKFMNMLETIKEKQ